MEVTQKKCDVIQCPPQYSREEVYFFLKTIEYDGIVIPPRWLSKLSCGILTNNIIRSDVHLFF